MKNTGFGYFHYTVSVWQSAEDAKAFAHSGAHLEAMKKAKSLASEVRICSFEGEKIPKWSEAKKLVQTQGRLIKY